MPFRSINQVDYAGVPGRQNELLFPRFVAGFRVGVLFVLGWSRVWIGLAYGFFRMVVRRARLVLVCSLGRVYDGFGLGSCS